MYFFKTEVCLTSWVPWIENHSCKALWGCWFLFFPNELGSHWSVYQVSTWTCFKKFILKYSRHIISLNVLEFISLVISLVSHSVHKPHSICLWIHSWALSWISYLILVNKIVLYMSKCSHFFYILSFVSVGCIYNNGIHG